LKEVIHDIRGRLLLFFPGEFENNNYRLLDAQDGWNYHKLAEGNGKGWQLLEKLTYAYLGDWIIRQKEGVKRGEGGAEDRLAAALELQKHLIAIIEGEPPFDIFVRWKPSEEQPIGWEPDINKQGMGELDKDKGKQLIRNSTAEFLIFTGQAGEQSIEARYEGETIWLSQKLMAQLFDVDIRTVNEHLKNIFKSGELQEDSVIRKFRITAADGKKYNTNFYNLDVIISVGYRVNSVRATQFRQWATQVLREFAIKGYVLDKKPGQKAHGKRNLPR